METLRLIVYDKLKFGWYKNNKPHSWIRKYVHKRFSRTTNVIHKDNYLGGYQCYFRCSP